MKNKKSQSEVISTVLIILVVLVAAGIVSGFVIKFISDRSSLKDCFDFNGKIEIGNDPKYTCYDSVNNRLIIQVKIGDVESKYSVAGLKIITESNGVSNSFDINSSGASPGVFMHDGTEFSIPQRSQARTYNLSLASKPNSTSVYPVLSNKKSCSEQVYTATFIGMC